MAEIITIGEIMMRLQPPSYKRFLQASSFELEFGGGEANVAVSLAQFGQNVAFCSKLPDNDLGTACIYKLRSLGVNTEFIARGGDRMGIYFCEKGASVRPSKVIYDRANSSITTISKNDIDVESMLIGTKWLHFTGITAALGDATLDFLREVLKIAKKKGITVSCDLNYRKKLWSKEMAREVMSELMSYVDVLISNEEDCKDVFGIEAENSSIEGGKLSSDGYLKVASIIKEKFGIKTVAFTLRESISASINNWSALLVKDGTAYLSRKYTLNIVDRVGGGDSFGAGLIYSLMQDYDGDTAINFAVAASAIKHTVEGDFNYATVSEVKALMSGGGSGRVQR